MDNPGQVLPTPDWEAELSAQLTLTLHSSPAAGQLRPKKKLNCLHEICCRYRYAQPATFYLNEMHASVQDTEAVPVNISCRFAHPIAVLAFGWRISPGSLWCLWGFREQTLASDVGDSTALSAAVFKKKCLSSSLGVWELLHS